jgi:hypothetical protein
MIRLSEMRFEHEMCKEVGCDLIAQSEAIVEQTGFFPFVSDIHSLLHGKPQSGKVQVISRYDSGLNQLRGGGRPFIAGLKQSLQRTFIYKVRTTGE